MHAHSPIDNTPTIKCKFAGAQGVGKSHLAKRLAKGEFIDDGYQTSFLSLVYKKDFSLNGSKLKTLIIDQGQRQPSKIFGDHPISLLFCVYDITNAESFLRLEIAIRKEKPALPHVSFVLIGNKCDDTSRRIVPTEAGKKLADELNIPFFETSAKNNIHVTEAFEAGLRTHIEKPIVPQSLMSLATNPSLPEQFLRGTWMVITAPFRAAWQLLTWPFKKCCVARPTSDTPSSNDYQLIPFETETRPSSRNSTSSYSRGSLRSMTESGRSSRSPSPSLTIRTETPTPYSYSKIKEKPSARPTSAPGTPFHLRLRA